MDSENLERLNVLGQALQDMSAALGLPVEWVWVGAFLFVMVPWTAIWWGIMTSAPRDHCHECSERDRKQFAKVGRAFKRAAVWSWSKVRADSRRLWRWGYE